jgi:beta-glucosidase
MPDLLFPDGFLWGAATSAHQTEGQNTHSDWWAWEQASKLPPSGRACDSWNRWREDIEAAAELGLGVYRISVEWARVEPEAGRFDHSAIEHYAEILRRARAHGMQTMVVLWHFTNPAWLADVNDWLWQQAPERFASYAAVMARGLGDLVDYWATLNEANTYVWRGYIVGVWPPGRGNAGLGAALAYRGLLHGHRMARKAIKEELGEGVPVGLTHVLAWPHPAEKGGHFSAPMCAWWNFLANDLFLDRAAPHCDWLGAQYYHDSPATAFSIADADGEWPRTDMGWRVVPRGIYEVVMRAWRRYRLPILITENGLADSQDAQRARFIIDHVAWLHKAIADGADVRGYLHWSLLDNFEWAHGFAPRFGHVEVDYDTLERRIRPSARVYAEMIRRNGVPEGFGNEFTYANGTGSLAPNG